MTDPGPLPNLDVPRPGMAAYVAAGLVALLLMLLAAGVFGNPGDGAEGWLIRIGALLLAAGVVLVAYAGWQRSKPGRLPGIAEDSISYNVERLRHRRDILRTAWIWMLLPLVPGIVLLYAGAAMQPAVGPVLAIGGLLIAALAFVAIAAFAVRAANRIEAQIAELERQREP